MSDSLISLSPEEFARLKRKLPAVTADQITATYGISETTWRKIRKGIPIRRTTLDRIYARYAKMS